MTEDKIIEQKFNSKKEGLIAIEILTATYGKKLESDSKLIIELLMNNKIIESKVIKYNQIEDNKFLRVSFEEIKDSLDKEFVIRMKTVDKKDEDITFWKGTSNEFPNSLYLNNESLEGFLIMNLVYSEPYYEFVHEGDDKLLIAELNEYSDKIEIVEKIIKGTESENLEKMKKEFIKNTIFVESFNNSAYQGEIEEDEYIEIISYKNDEIKIKTSLNHSRYISINDYYDKNWVAYSGDESLEIIKANYLTRAVLAPEGSNIITLKYENHKLKTLIIVSIVTIIFVLILIFYLLFKERMNNSNRHKTIEKINLKEEIK